MAAKKLTVPDKAWSSLSKKEQADLLPLVKNLSWKHEGRQGPLYVVFKQKEKTMLGSDNVIRNYEDGFVGGSHTFAAWFTESRAHQIAKSMGKELETV